MGWGFSVAESCYLRMSTTLAILIWTGADEQAKRDVAEGEELTYDYADASGIGRDSQGQDIGEAGEGLTKCLCGASSCRGWMPFDPDLN